MKKIIVFVEGSDDEYFIKSLFGEDKISIVRYARQGNIKTKIKNLKQSGFKVIMLHDADFKEELTVKQCIAHKYSLDLKDVYVAVMEIESWYAAGVTDNLRIELKIKKIPKSTEKFSKEQFNALSENLDHSDLIVEIMKGFDIEIAKTRNQSFTTFYNEMHKLLY